ncbi:hypothetical protein RH915_02800 [Serpentinicella sp. ANB-PHB4]|uniref:hypothetical protein n=1 Tax=Serpentinicella sp. ANB-PHB4 TaxID=3074076 RepID=UPI00285B8B48|nr:hypothetical protein [Serpentinicella sp. ANB-PHB4]MDR5658410.1 hypothetical protein [Serpentinicella sp. ANB-PHB4]
MSINFMNLKEFDKVACIIADKIFAQCKKNVCIPNAEIPFENRKIKQIIFSNGIIKNGSLSINTIKNQSNFKRVVFEVEVPFQAESNDEKVYKGLISNIKQDLILFMPDANRSEFDFEVKLDTRSQVLEEVTEQNEIYYKFGITLLISVVGRVQLFIPYMGFCPEAPICIDFELDLCEKFHDAPFPDFYPPQQPERKRILIRKDIKVRKINDVIVYGHIKQCYTKKQVEGAIIKAFYKDKQGILRDICHTYSGCDGYYMLRIPPKFEGETITMMVSKDNCTDSPESCECET